MLAQPQSTPAARIPVTPLSTPPAPDSPTRLGSHSPAQPRSDPATQQHPQPSIRHLLAASPFRPLDSLQCVIPLSRDGIAQGAGLAHDAGNLLGALGLYCDLLRAPGVLGPEHRHYATELGLIASRSSELIRRLLARPGEQTETRERPQRQSGTQILVSAESVTGSGRPLAGAAWDHAGALRTQPAFLTAGGRRDPAQRDASQTATSPPALTHTSALRLLGPVLERIAAGSATVSIWVPATLPQLDLSIEALERITVNLVRNAAEAIRSACGNATPARAGSTPDGASTRASNSARRPTATIRVGLGVAAGRLRLTVEDDGPGMPPAVAAAFLQPGPLPAKPGRGLGHRIVHELVAASGGHISIRVRPGQGTVFCIRWPVPISVSDGDGCADEGLRIGNHNSSYFGPAARPELATTSRLAVPSLAVPSLTVPSLTSPHLTVQGETRRC
jgi:signal transduction histidine kinase